MMMALRIHYWSSAGILGHALDESNSCSVASISREVEVLLASLRKVDWDFLRMRSPDLGLVDRDNRARMLNQLAEYKAYIFTFDSFMRV